MSTEPTLHALVVDDDVRWRALISEILHAAGWRVTAIGEPPEAVSGYHLAVLDVALNPATPDKRDGMAVLDRLADTNTPCVLLSGLADPDLVVEAGRRPHVLAWIHKDSFRREAFLALVRQVTAPAHLPPNEGEPPPAEGPRVLIVEDDARWRAIYEEILAEAGYGSRCAASYGEARTWLQRAGFAAAVVDLHLLSSTAPGDNRDGFWFLRAARQRGVPAVVVSALGAPEDIDRAFEEFGVFAFVEKEAFDRRAFADILAEAAHAAAPAPPSPDEPALPPDLTDREREVLALLTQGRTNRQIAEALLISPNTVKKHVDHILQKLGVRTRAGAVAAALQAGSNTPEASGRAPSPMARSGPASPLA
jgi:DNA-binding NarL/FixJ family response regulator